MSNAEQQMDISQLLTKMTDACVQSAHQLSSTQSTTASEQSVHYVIPTMSVELKLKLSSQAGTIKGLITKSNTSSSAESVSTIKMDLVAVPKTE